MKRLWLSLALLTTAQPVWAGGGDAPYYGPMKRWHGIGYKFGYEERLEKDGSWRIDAAVRSHGDAIDIALYRAAEIARAQGYRYVHLLGGKGSRSPGIDAATLYARPSHDDGAPVGCRSKTVTSCYTANVAEILRVLGGPGGTQPGVPIVDHRDLYGRDVFLSGYGTGAVATLVPGAIGRSKLETIVEGRAATVRPAPASVPYPRIETVAQIAVAATPLPPHPDYAAAAASARFDRALRENTPIRGGSKQGWTVGE